MDSERYGEDEYDERPVRKKAESEQVGSTSQEPAGVRNDSQEPSESPITQRGEDSEGTPSNHRENARQPLLLKSPKRAPCIVRIAQGEGAEASSGGVGGSTVWEGRCLTDAEQSEFDEIGKDFAAQELQKMGFSVERMPRFNPGFDLRASRAGEELRVEVKGHSGRGSVVNVTCREYEEYLRMEGYSWELWNVEHLAEDDSCTVVITRYDHISEEALNTRIFRVDLKKCRKSLQG